MADDIKEVKKDIWLVKQKIEKEEKERQGWAEQYALVQELLKADPNNTEASELKAEIEQSIAASGSAIEPLQAKLAALEARLPKAPEPVAPKFDPEKHPLLKKSLEKNEPAKPVVFNTGDICEAQWTDKAWYKAKIQTILGSASAPKYHVRFLDYDDTMTLDRDSLRPLQNKRKRDGEPAPSTAVALASQNATTSTPHVISGPVSINPSLQTAKETPHENTEPTKRKIPNKKQLEKGVNSWKNWNSKGVGKKLSQKESMFRSGTNVNSRVGFTGSGAGMTETHKRVRYNNKADAEADEDEGGGFAKKPRPY